MNPRVRRVAENFRRIERRHVIAEIIVRALKGRPGGVDDEGGQPEKHEQRLRPPCVGSHGLTERPAWNRRRSRSVHLPSAPSTGSFALFQASQLPGTFQSWLNPAGFKMLAAILDR